jgi:hypothetical protein
MNSGLHDYSGFIDRERNTTHPNYRMRFNPRDVRILQDIHSYGGLLKDTHIRDLEFPGTHGKAYKRRLTKLFHNGYLARTNAVGTSHSGGVVYWLTEKGAGAVSRGFDGGIPFTQVVFTPVWAHIRHDLKIVDILLAVRQACEESRGEFELREWTLERELRADVKAVPYTTQTGRKTTRKVIPDLYLRIHRRKRHNKPFASRLLLEVDNSTHPHGRFAENKILPGLKWVKSEAYKQRFGEKRGRWLVVTKSRARLDFLRETAQRVAGNEAFLWNFAVASDLTAESIFTQPIWYPGDLQRQPVALFPAHA